MSSDPLFVGVFFREVFESECVFVFCEVQANILAFAEKIQPQALKTIG